MDEKDHARRSRFNVRAIPWLPCIAFSLVLYDCYVPGHRPYLLLGFFIWFCIAGFSSVRFVLELLLIIPRRLHLQWATVVLFCLSLLATSPYPKSMAFKVSLPEFEHFVSNLGSKPVAFNTPIFDAQHKIRAQVGLFRIYDWQIGADGTVYLITNYQSTLYNGIHGFAFHKPRLADFNNVGTVKAKPIFGDWYEFEYFRIYYSGRWL